MPLNLLEDVAVVRYHATAHLVKILAKNFLAAKTLVKVVAKIAVNQTVLKTAEPIAVPKRKGVSDRAAVTKRKDVLIASNKAVNAPNVIVALQVVPSLTVAANKTVITMREENPMQIHHQVRTISNLKYVFRPEHSENETVYHFYPTSLHTDNRLQPQQIQF